MWSNKARSGSTLRAKPCIDRPRVTRTPMAQILRGAGPVGVDPHARVARPAARRGRPSSARVSITTCSIAVRRGAGTERGAGGHVDDRVADQLARPVVGDVAAPVGSHQLGPDRGRVDEHVGRVGVHPERVDVRVLEQQQVVVAARGRAGRAAARAPRVGDPTQPANPEHRRPVSARVPAQSSAAQSWVSRISVTRARNAAA